ncbi:MAG: sporulation transcriptional regulator SpoIIID [Ruminococcaceae bacterium]|nr:sporulation transcriptional regulator SpoIIID [Oscillospiraceae bacterium]
MINNSKIRCIELGEYIIKTKATVRQAAQVFGISKSTVHMDVTKRLSKISPSLAKEVNKVLQENKAVRHIRGGLATKEKYLKAKINKS